MATAPNVSSIPPTPQKATGSHFYKYASLEHTHEDEHKMRLGWLEKTILNHQLYVPDVTQLNDPAEGRPRLTPLSEQQLFKFLYRGKYGVVARDPGRRIGRVLDAMILDVNIRRHTPSTILRNISDILFDQLKDTKVYCLSKRATNMSMWAKYADDHHGYCLEFGNEGDFFRHAKEVIYGDVVDLDIAQEGHISGWFFYCKGNDWSNEEEIRIHGSRKNPHEVNIDPRVLTRIILGWHMREADRTLIHQWARRRKPELTVATASWNEYERKLDIVP